MASSVSANHCAAGEVLRRRRGRAAARGPAAAGGAREDLAGPANIPQQTKTPTATKASSLTSDSNAIAATMPSWRSLLSRWRVPKAMVKPASSQRDVERAVLPPRPGACPALPGQQRQPAGDRLQLQRHVGQDADQRDQRHQRGQRAALAVAAGDEVGDRGDAVARARCGSSCAARSRPAACRASGRGRSAGTTGPSWRRARRCRSRSRRCSTRRSTARRPRRCRSASGPAGRAPSA